VTGKVSVEEAMANSDSPTNLHWLLSNAPKTASGEHAPAPGTKSGDLNSIKLNLDALG
jgi:hypothetical protein